MKKHALIILITLIAGVLRFYDLGEKPLWIDEAFFAHLAEDYIMKQEYPTVFLVNMFGLYESEFMLRFIFALAGTLTIPAVYIAVKNYKLQASLFTAVFPLFIFWSRIARPYAFIGLFMVLGWRWWYFNITGILTNPLSVIGIKFKKDKWKISLVLLAIGAVIYLSREDLGAMSYGVRMLYIPALAAVLWITEKKYSDNWVRIAYWIIIGICLSFFPSNKYSKWYSNEVQYSDWREAGEFHFSTNAHVSNYYSNGHALEYKPKFVDAFINAIAEGHTIKLGLDYYALRGGHFDIFPIEIQRIIKKNKEKLLNGEIVRLSIDLKGIQEY